MEAKINKRSNVPFIIYQFIQIYMHFHAIKSKNLCNLDILF